MKTFVNAFVAILAAFCLSTPAGAQTQFIEVAAAAGVDIDTYNGVNNHALGMNWIDIDNDGYDDLFVVNGFGGAPHLFRNDADGSKTFTVSDELLPPPCGVTTVNCLPDVEMMESVFGDLDNDGDSDIYLIVDTHDAATITAPPNLLLRNL